MKKGYYIAPESGKAPGVDRKVNSQNEIFKEHFDIKVLYLKKQKTNFFKSISWRLPFGSYGIEYGEVLDKIENVDFIYMRFSSMDLAQITFIRKVRQKCPNAKFIMEIPTFPYAKELLQNKEMWPFYFKDLFYQKKLKKYVDRIVTYSEDDYIFGIPTIKTKNGIDVSKVTPIQNTELDETIDLLTVAMFQKYHGYERVIKGLEEYYASGKGKRKVILHMVGDGKQISCYKEAVKKSGLEKYVIFYGRKQGEELERLYEKADIALGAFAYYRIKVKRSSMLKVREYLSKGLPFASACNEDVFLENKPYFYLNFPNDNSTVNICEIVKFYDDLYEGERAKQQVIRDVRKFAKNNVDMAIVMKPVIDYIQEE